jgi:GR25 family glycosyltransferase involved in LPS biosynthesis
MNNFDVIYIINLKHRTDRLESIMNELTNMGVDMSKVKRVDAIYNKEFGALGCAQSHRLALSMFLKDKDAKNCLVLEDDFIFTREKEYVETTVNEVMNSLKNNWDVLMLSANIIAASDRQGNEKYIKIYDAQTTSGYAVTKEFAPKLVECFKNSEQNMKKFFKVYHDSLIKHNFAIDMNWKSLQPVSRWYSIYPCVGKQQDGYSDIEQREVRYGC